MRDSLFNNRWRWRSLLAGAALVAMAGAALAAVSDGSLVDLAMLAIVAVAGLRLVVERLPATAAKIKWTAGVLLLALLAVELSMGHYMHAVWPGFWLALQLGRWLSRQVYPPSWRGKKSWRKDLYAMR